MRVPHIAFGNEIPSFKIGISEAEKRQSVRREILDDLALELKHPDTSAQRIVTLASRKWVHIVYMTSKYILKQRNTNQDQDGG